MIRYDKRLNREIERTIRNFNAKVKRLEKKSHEALPAYESVTNLKSDYTSRYELKRKLKELQRFSKRGAEEIVRTKGGAVTTRWYLSEIKREQRTMLKRKQKELEKLQSSTKKMFGKPSYAMGSEEISNVKASINLLKKDVTSLKPSKFKQISGQILNLAVKDLSKRWNLYNNIGDIFMHVTEMAGCESYKVDKVFNTLSKLSFNEWNNMYEKEHVFTILLETYTDIKLASANTYESTAQEIRDIIDMLYENIDEMVKEYKDK